MCLVLSTGECDGLFLEKKIYLWHWAECRSQQCCYKKQWLGAVSFVLLHHISMPWILIFSPSPNCCNFDENTEQSSPRTLLYQIICRYWEFCACVIRVFVWKRQIVRIFPFGGIAVPSAKQCPLCSHFAKFILGVLFENDPEFKVYFYIFHNCHNCVKYWLIFGILLLRQSALSNTLQ